MAAISGRYSARRAMAWRRQYHAQGRPLPRPAQYRFWDAASWHGAGEVVAEENQAMLNQTEAAAGAMEEPSTEGTATAIQFANDEQQPAAEGELTGRKSVVDDFAGYRALRRRIDDVERTGQSVPFFQPRDGVSHSVIRRQEKSLINYSGYNYLGLSGHPAVSAAAKNAIDKYGTSASASRIVSGQIELHGELERRLANFLGTEDALVFISGYLTNVSVISQLLGATGCGDLRFRRA